MPLLNSLQPSHFAAHHHSWTLAHFLMTVSSVPLDKVNSPSFVLFVLHDERLLCTSPRRDFYIGLSVTRKINHSNLLNYVLSPFLSCISFDSGWYEVGHPITGFLGSIMSWKLISGSEPKFFHHGDDHPQVPYISRKCELTFSWLKVANRRSHNMSSLHITVNGIERRFRDRYLVSRSPVTWIISTGRWCSSKTAGSGI